MESQSEEIDRDGGERRSSNTEYTPTKCRTTRPQPPKPATNPLQFVKVQPCELYRKAQEQIKKVEEVKVIREVVKEDAEDWQHNLDNWKSSRRKRQEHIIERVVEVKKMEQEEHDKGRRKTKTFSEMLGDKSRGRHKLNIPIYDDDSNDLSDYGIGSSSSKTNSIKDVDTDDNSSVLDDRDITQFDSVVGNKETSTSSRSQSEDETNTKQTNSEHANSIKYSSEEANNSSDSSKAASKNIPRPTPSNNTLPQTVLYSEPPSEVTEQYTYEGAIQDYRTRIRSKINVGEAVFGKQSTQQDVSKSKEFSEAQNLLPKGNLFKRKEIFDKSVEISSYESTTVRRLSEDFAHSQSIKERLQCLEKCTDQPLRPVEKGDGVGSVKSKVQSFIKQSEVVADVKNNNSTAKAAKPTADSLTSMLNNNKTIASYLMEKSSSNSSFEEKNDWRSNKEYFERTASPESEMFMNKLNEFNRDLDTIYGKSGNLDEFVTNCNYPASTSSTELMALSSDREDSGIHTADVSCSVSQADEPFDDADISSQTIPSCIEKLTKENDKYNPTEEAISITAAAKPTAEDERILETVVEYVEPPPEVEPTTFSNTFLRATTLTLLDSERRESLQSQQMPESHSPLVEHIEKTIKHDNLDEIEPDLKMVIYENVELKPKKLDLNPVQSYFNMDSFSVDLEPPNIKPPPPPPTDDNTDEEDTTELVPSTDSPVKRINSTKRIKKELHIKRSSFLGLEEPTDDQIEPGLALQRPPDINSFLQQESLREKSLQKTLQMSREQRNSSQDSDAVRRSQRQDSELTVSSFTSEEDEISKKEREIIEMVEKEEKSRDYEYVGPVVEINPTVQPVETTQSVTPFNPTKSYANNYDNNLGSEKFDTPFFPQHYEPIDAQDSEVLKVEHELLQLEREELERQRENQLFRENRAKLLQNRHSYENICDVDFAAQQQIQQKQQQVPPPNYPPNNQVFEYRKSMPDLPHLPLDYRNSLPNSIVSQQVRNVNVVQQVPVMLPADDFHFHRKSMPDIQHAYNRSIAEYRGTQSPLQPESGIGQLGTTVDYRKSMPELLQDDVGASRRQFALPGSSNSSTSGSSGVSNRAMIGDKPIRHFIGGKEQREKERFMMLNPVESDALHNTTPPSSVLRPLTRHSLHALSAAPKSRQMDNWLQPKPHTAAGATASNGAVATTMSSHHHHHVTAAAQAQAQPPEQLVKHYNQHWLCQEAELRRLAELKSPAQRLLHTAGTNNSNGVGNRPLMPNAKPPAKHIPEAVIQKLTQRVQNRGLGERAPPAARINNLVRPEINQPAQLAQQSAHNYLGHPSTFGHALPMPYGQFSTSAATAEEYPDNTKLSVSGKKKCSYCGIELGRGAAMIIETLCLFYHMDCFKCSVCRTALGDGMIGTDVRVRNDKLHCHNCYSNEDGVKYSCV